MKFNKLPALDVLNSLLAYNPETGDLTWKPRTPDMFASGFHSAETSCKRWNTKHSGKIASNLSNSGYVRVNVFGERFMAHRVIWQMLYGNSDKFEIDHINGDRLDNRLVNLRAVTHEDNMKNIKLRADSKHGALGVSYSKRDKTYAAEITSGGVKYRLGCFKTLEAAIAARRTAEIKHGFHPNHGRAA